MNKTRTAARGHTKPGHRIVGRPSQHDRPPLPPGHPTTWALLTAGTVLDGADYPHPVFTS